MPPRSTPSISRQAKGLPRFYMDCGWWRHPRFVGLAPDALFLFQAAVGYCTEHGTDGRLPAHHEDLAAALGIRASHVRKALPPLVKCGAIEPTTDALVIRNWAEHNPTSVEVEEFNRSKAKSGALGNHKRWHEGRGVNDPECEFCDSPSDPTTIAPAIPNRSHDGSHGMGWDGSSPSSPPSHPDDDPPDVAGAGAPPEEDQPRTPERTATLAIEHMARCDLRTKQATGEPVKLPDRWLAKALETRHAQAWDQLVQAATERPTADPVTLAEEIDPACGPDDGGLARAKAEAAKSARAAEDQAARRAENTAWREQADAILEGLGTDDFTALADQAREINPTLLRHEMRRLAMEHHAPQETTAP